MEFKIPIEGGEGGTGGLDRAIRDGLDRLEGCSVAARDDGLCTWVVVRCSEGVSDEVRGVIDEALDASGVRDACRREITDVLAEGDGDPVFYPRPGRGGRGGGYFGGDGGGAAFQC